MFPIRDENPQLRIPFVTFVIIALNAAAWIFFQGLGSEPALTWSVCRLGLIPGDLFGTVDVSQVSQRLPCPIDGQGTWLTILSSMFMHGSWMHIVGNMWFMWIFGGNVEDSIRRQRRRFHGPHTVRLLLCSLRHRRCGGATVRKYGVAHSDGRCIGRYRGRDGRLHHAVSARARAHFMLGYWIIVQVLGGIMSVGVTGGGVAFWAHVGGFAAGAVLILLFKDNRLLDKHPYHGWRQKKHASQSWHRVSRDRRRRR
jgi:membrane associated rhomboid family serine protease